MTQGKQTEWIEQWEMFECDDLFLFGDWINPYKPSDFRGKYILECGCGGGQHTNLMAPFATSITAVDLNTIDVAADRNSHNDNVIFIEEDIANMDLGKTFDIVLSIGVVHHTDDPDQTVNNLKRHVKQGGYLILWVYSYEGNFLLLNCRTVAKTISNETKAGHTFETINHAYGNFVYTSIYWFTE